MLNLSNTTCFGYHLWRLTFRAETCSRE